MVKIHFVPMYILIIIIPFSKAKGPCKDFQPCLAYTNEQSNTLVCTSIAEYREKFLSIAATIHIHHGLNWTTEYAEHGMKYCETEVPCVPVDPTTDRGHANLVHYATYYSDTDTFLICNSQDRAKRCPNGAVCRYDYLESETFTCELPDPKYAIIERSQYSNLSNPYTHSEVWQDFLKYAGENYCASGTCVRAIPKHEDDVTTICADPNEPDYDPWNIKCENNKICFLNCPDPTFQNAGLVRGLFKSEFFGIQWTNDHGRGDCNPKYHDKCSLSDEDRDLLNSRLEYLGNHYCKSGRCGYTYKQTLEFLIPICVDEDWIPPDISRGGISFGDLMWNIVSIVTANIILVHYKTIL